MLRRRYCPGSMAAVDADEETSSTVGQKAKRGPLPHPSRAETGVINHTVLAQGHWGALCDQHYFDFLRCFPNKRYTLGRPRSRDYFFNNNVTPILSVAMQNGGDEQLVGRCAC